MYTVVLIVLTQWIKQKRRVPTSTMVLVYRVISTGCVAACHSSKTELLPGGAFFTERRHRLVTCVDPVDQSLGWAIVACITTRHRLTTECFVSHTRHTPWTHRGNVTKGSGAIQITGRSLCLATVTKGAVVFARSTKLTADIVCLGSYVFHSSRCDCVTHLESCIAKASCFSDKFVALLGVCRAGCRLNLLIFTWLG